jgi:hypothetical protein
MVYDRSRNVLVFDGDSGIWDFDPVAGQSTLRQPGAPGGLAAFDTARGVTTIASVLTTDYNGAATGVSPYLVSSMVSGAYTAGQTIQLTAEFGGTGPIAYRWYHGAQVLTDGGRISGATTSTLTITNANVFDSGGYSANVSNACNSAGVGGGVTVEPPCYPNCDGSTTPPVLSVNDFICFQSAFAAGLAYANCDHASQPPIFNVNDFICFAVRFAQGCR